MYIEVCLIASCRLKYMRDVYPGVRAVAPRYLVFAIFTIA